MTLPALANVLSVGARTPLGLDACQTAMLLRAGFATMAPAPLGPDGEDVTVCHNPALSEVGAERAAALGAAALDEALAALDERFGADTRVKLYLTLDADAGEPERVAAEVLQHAQRRFRGCQIDVTARGGGGGGLALARAIRRLGERRADVCILGGVHCDYDAGRIARLLAEGRLYSDDNLDSLLPGESAAFVVLAPARHEGGLARIAGIGNGMAEAKSDNDEPSAPARSATACVRQATAALEQEGARAGWLLSDVGLENWRMREQQTVLVRQHRVLGEPYRIDHPAQRIGDMGAAALPLCLTLACEGFLREHAPSPIALITAGSDSGERSAVVVTRAPG